MIYGKLTTGLMVIDFILIPSNQNVYIKRAFVMPDIIIRRNNINFVESASNLGVIFISRLITLMSPLVKFTVC